MDECHQLCAAASALAQGDTELVLPGLTPAYRGFSTLRPF
jgi:hypothetical protein